MIHKFSCPYCCGDISLDKGILIKKYCFYTQYFCIYCSIELDVKWIIFMKKALLKIEAKQLYEGAT